MTEREVRELVTTDPLPDKWNGKRKVRENVYHSAKGEQTQVAARRKLKRARRERKPQNGFYCPGGKHEGIYREYGRWYAYLHFAKYE